MGAVPEAQAWLFWELDLAAVDLVRDADSILARVLERGRLVDVQWAIATFGLDRIHRFFREVGHPEVSDRTLQFWRAALGAGDEMWATPPSWRKGSSAPWID